MVAVATTAALAGAMLAAAPAVHAARPGTLTGLACIGDLLDGGDTDLNTCAAGNEHIAGTGVPVVNAAGTMVYVSNYNEHTVVWFSRAANGALTAQGCISDAPAPVGCSEAEGLSFVWGIQLSPDGRQLYAAGNGDEAIVRLDVAVNGSLSDGGCISAPDGPCATTSPWLDGSYSVDVSADGKDVYVGTWRNGGGVVQLRRATSGGLTATSCVAAASEGGCVAAPAVTQVSWLDVSPDGRSVYTTSANGSVAMLKRAPATGRLTAQGCLVDSEMDDPSLGCAGEAKAIAGAQGIITSGDGSSVYVVASTDSAVTHLRRSADGTLAEVGCVQDLSAGVPVASGCARSTEGLGQVAFITMEPDDDQVLTGSVGDNAVTTLDRAADGNLAGSSCITDLDESEAACATKAEGLNGSYALAVSPDGRNVYVGGWSDHALAILKRQVVAPAAALAAAKRQRLTKLAVTLRGNARATATVTGVATATYRVKVGKKVRTKRARFVLRPARVTVLPSTNVTARLTFKKQAALRKLLSRGARVSLKLTATTTNTGGRTTGKATVRLRR